MITQELTEAMIEEWKSLWVNYKDKLQPNRKSGGEVLNYLQNRYEVTEFYDKEYQDIITYNIVMNEVHAEKLPANIKPIPKVFFIENVEKNKVLYEQKNRDHNEEVDDEDTKIVVGIDMVSGYYYVEGSSYLYDELCAYRGLDEIDLQNYVLVGEYIKSLKRFNLLNTIVGNE